MFANLFINSLVIQRKNIKPKYLGTTIPHPQLIFFYRKFIIQEKIFDIIINNLR